MVWFRMNVGRTNNADPKWIVPVICRLGHVTKNEIGVIKIFDRETKFEIIESVAARFAASVRKSSNDESVNIQPAAGAMQEMKKYLPKTDRSPRRDYDPDAKRAHAGAGKPPFKGGFQDGPKEPRKDFQPKEHKPKEHRAKEHRPAEAGAPFRPCEQRPAGAGKPFKKKNRPARD
jgi:ATP-dependent RNA helicase DeaD